MQVREISTAGEILKQKSVPVAKSVRQLIQELQDQVTALKAEVEALKSGRK